MDASEWIAKGNQAFESGNYQEAANAYEEATRLENDNAEGWFSLGVSLFKLGQFEQSLYALNQIVVKPEDCADGAWIWIARAETLHAMGRSEEALSSLESAAGLGCEEANVWQKIGDVYLQYERLAEGAKALEMAAGLAANDAGIWRKLGDTFNKLEVYEKAAQAFDQAIQADPEIKQDWIFLLQRAIALNSTTRFTEALDHTEKAIELAGEEPGIGYLWYHKGVALNGLGRHEEALAALQEASDRFTGKEPVTGYLWLHKGVALNGLGRHEEALEALEEASSLIPDGTDHAVVLFQKGRALQGLQQHSKALEVFKQAFQLKTEIPSSAILLFFIGSCYQKLGQNEQALQASEEGLNASPGQQEQGLLLLRKGAVLHTLKRYAEALIALETSVNYLPEGPERGAAWFQKGQALMLLNQEVDALKALEAASQEAPSIPGVWNLRGVLLQKAGDEVEALASFRRAVELDPASLEAWDQIGRLLLSRREYGEALEVYEQVTGTGLEGVPAQLASAWFGKAIALSNLGRYEEAQKALAKASELQSEFLELPIYWMSKVSTHLKLHDERGFATQLEQARAAYPSLKEHPLLLVIWGNLLMNVFGRNDEGMQAIVQAVEPPPKLQNDALAWLGASMARSTVNPGESALEAIEKAVQIDQTIAPQLVSTIRGMALLTANHHQAALDEYQKLEGNDDVWVFRGMAFAGLGDVPKALYALDQAILVAEESRTGNLYTTLAYLQKGYLLLNNDKLGEAIEAFDQAIEHGTKLPEHDPNRMSAILGKGMAFIKEKKEEDGLKLVSQAAHMSDRLPEGFPHRGVAWWFHSEVLANQERYDQALASFTRAARLEPENPNIALGKANALLQLQDYEQAEKAFDEALLLCKEKNHRMRAFLGKGLSLSRQERYEKAIEIYRQAISEDIEEEQRAWQVWEALGEAYSTLDRHRSALQAFKGGWQLDKAGVLAQGISAEFIYLKRYQEALDFLDKANPASAKPNAELDYNRGVAVYHLNGAVKGASEARASWRKAADAGLERARELVDTLEPGQLRSGTWFDFWFVSSLIKSYT